MSPKNKASKKNSGRKNAAKRQKSTGIKRRVIIVSLLLCLAMFALFLDISVVSTDAMMPNLSKDDVVISFMPRFLPYAYTDGQILKIKTDDHPTHPNYLRLVASGKHEISYDSSITIDAVPIGRTMLTNPAIARPDNEPELWREILPNGVEYRISLAPDALTGNLDGTLNLTDEQFFLVGDNRTGSYDSRHHGAFTKDDIQGRVLFILYSSRNDALFGHLLKF